MRNINDIDLYQRFFSNNSLSDLDRIKTTVEYLVDLNNQNDKTNSNSANKYISKSEVYFGEINRRGLVGCAERENGWYIYVVYEYERCDIDFIGPFTAFGAVKAMACALSIKVQIKCLEFTPEELHIYLNSTVTYDKFMESDRHGKIIFRR